MMEHIIVCEQNDELIRSFEGKAIVVKTKDPFAIPHIKRIVGENNKLHCIELYYNSKLTSLPANDEWAGIPIHVYAQRFGVFRELMEKTGIFRHLNARFFLSTDMPENFTFLQIMSSLDIDCGLIFGAKKIDWEAVKDLMYFYAYGKVQHGSVEPFSFILKEYRPDKRINFGSVYFENPERYIHINASGNAALSSKDLANGDFILENISDLHLLREKQEYKDYLHRWQEFFLSDEGCATCPAWRICQGKFSEQMKENPGCSQLFSDLMDAADLRNNQRKEVVQKELCQP